MKKSFFVSILTLLFSFSLLLKKIPLGKTGEWVWKYYHGINFWWRIFFPIGVFILIYPIFLLNKKLKFSLSLLLILLFFFTFMVKVSFQYFSPLGLEGNVLILSYPWISGYFTEAQRMTLKKEYFSTYPKEVEYYHVKLHPPMMSLLCRGITKLFYQSPSFTHVFLKVSSHSILDAREAFRFLESKEKWHLRDFQKASLIFLGLLLPFLSSLGIIPLYLLLRRHPQSLPITLLYTFIPSLLLFSPSMEEILPVFVLFSIYFLRKESNSGFFLSGLFLAIGSLFSISLLLILLYILISKRGKKLTYFSLAGFLGFIFLFHFLTGFSFFQYLFRLSPGFTEAGRVNLLGVGTGRTYLFWVIYDPLEFFIFAGIPLSALFFFGLPSLSLSEKLTLLGIFLFLNFSGISLSEVARLWSPLLPLLFLGAIRSKERMPYANLFYFPLFQFIQAILMKGVLDVFTLV